MEMKRTVSTKTPVNEKEMWIVHTIQFHKGSILWRRIECNLSAPSYLGLSIFVNFSTFRQNSPLKSSYIPSQYFKMIRCR